MYRKLMLLIVVLLVTPCLASDDKNPTADSATCPIPFFAMDNGTKDANHQTPESQVKMLKELGFPGVGWRPQENMPEMLAILDMEGLKMYTVYLGIEINGPNQPIPKVVLDTIDQLKGHDTILWLYINKNKRCKTPSDEAGDVDAVPLLQKIADRAQEANLKVALYPHTRYWMERIQDAVRLAKKVDRPNLGVTFNLCHCIKVGDEKKISQLLEAAYPYLFLVSINGADHEGNWDKLIRPLGQGDFDIVPVLKKLKQLGYTSPIGLQHYGIRGDAKKNLKQSLDAWRRFSSQVWL